MTTDRYAVDHVFVCCAEGAPEADRLTRLGLAEGSSNTHPGQGTASRRFFFENAYLELFWVTDAREAQSELAAPTRLWSRWSQRGAGASPFAIILRPGDDEDAPPPFPSWAYHPPYLPPHLAIHLAEGTPLSEPAFFYLGFARGAAHMQAQPRAHASRRPPHHRRRDRPAPRGAPQSRPRNSSRPRASCSSSNPSAHVMTLTFDGARRGEAAALHPDLPLVLRW